MNKLERIQDTISLLSTLDADEISQIITFALLSAETALHGTLKSAQQDQIFTDGANLLDDLSRAPDTQEVGNRLRNLTLRIYR
jgi:hypothetical protein